MASALLAGLAASAFAEDPRTRTDRTAQIQPSADFDGNWYVLRRGQTLAEFASATGLALDALDERFQRVDRRWLDALRRDIAKRWPELRAAWGGRIRLPHAGLSHEVEPDEDIWALSRRFKTSALELRIVNGWTEVEAEQLRAGQRVLVPGVVRARDGHVTHLPRPAPKGAAARAARLGLGKRATAGALLRGELDEAWVEAAGGERGAGTFNWPVIGGWRVRGFGSGKEGYHKAIDIGGRVGWPARAIDDGLVAYAGDELRGYGNIVMVLHPGRFVSFYAHLSAVFVSAGERVRRAEVIAELGSTGISRGPHLHFELIHDHGNCDPEPLFRPGVRDHDGELIGVEQARWDGRGTSPAAVRCEHRPAHHPDSRWVEDEP